MRSRRLLVLLLTLACGLGVLLTGGSGGSASATTGSGPGWGGDDSTLVPGEPLTLRQRIPVNVVLVGYDEREVGPGLLGQLAASAAPVVRFPRYYGIKGRDLGLRFDYDYRLVDTPAGFEDRFFAHLAETGTPAPLTGPQQSYNAQRTNVRDVTGPVLTLDAPDTERYLERAARDRLGLDTQRGYTVFLVDWWGRDDFRDHVYRSTGTVDPDTGRNFGLADSRAMIAWGGESGRTWFYDLSAGPHAWTSNWNVDVPDLNGDGVRDYRMPPVWEYVDGGNRARSALGPDLGRVVRYVAVNLLFTASPQFDPLVTAPQPGGAKDVRLTVLQDNPDQDGTGLVDVQDSVAAWQRLEPYHRFEVGLQDRRATPSARRSLAIWSGRSSASDCWTQYRSPFAQLYCWADARRDRYLPPAGPDYVQGVFAFSTTDEGMGKRDGVLGFADDNWVDGTQSYVFTFTYPRAVGRGYGLTTSTTHEVGHHLGLSHPHDGFDPETGDYQATGKFTFANVGDESATVMSYNALSNRFDQFDRDNMARYQLAGYLRWAAQLLGDLQGADLSEAEAGRLEDADQLAGQAVRAFRRWEYLRGAGQARAAWALVRSVADDHDVALAPPAPRLARRSAGGPVVLPDPYPIR